jgi:cytochrome P450
MATMLWQLNNTHGLAFWMLLHILSGPGIADAVREEMKPYVQATQPEKFMGFAQPVTLKLDTEGLMTKCPTMMSCYLETVRLYGREWWCGKLATDYLVNEENGLAWKLKAGEWVDVPFWLGNKDEGLFHPDPEVWRWERHVDYVKAVMGGDADVEGQIFQNCKTIL